MADSQELRKALIRLAHENPGEVRDAVLPLIKEGYSEELPEETAGDKIKDQIQEIIPLLRQAMPKQPRMRMMILADVCGRLMDAIETDMTHGAPANMNFGFRQLRQLRERIRNVIGKLS